MIWSYIIIFVFGICFVSVFSRVAGISLTFVQKIVISIMGTVFGIFVADFMFAPGWAQFMEDSLLRGDWFGEGPGWSDSVIELLRGIWRYVSDVIRG